ncbi:protein Wnt-5 isoform X2 [Bradysia coprophila]|nr:protein Wnt-5 isoform X2 [Bradysia coprophila]
MQQNRVENVENPVIEDMNNKKEVTIIEVHDDEYLDDKSETERKYIIPLALKNPAAEPRKSQIFQDSSTNIDDLKRHILMLQNLTKNDQSFQSKFVVFPNLQQNVTEPTTTKRPLIRANPTRRLHLINTPRQTTFKDAESDDLLPPQRNDRLTIVPQVFLQNDQTPMNDESFEDKRDDKKEIRVNYTKRKSFRSSMFLTTTNRPTTKRTTRKQKNGPKRNRNFNKKKRCKDTMNKEINCFGDGINRDHNRTIEMKQINQTVLHSSDYTKTSVNYPHASGDENKKLYRSVRSHQRNASKELLFPSSLNATQPTNAYKENIDLNPELCYSVGGLSFGQQKLCVAHTNIMPAISRGARSAIQECQHQFKSRRWNCSTVENDSVFGPITAIGSPEMAFVHALAAAGAASFVARACRDGQLTSCGCSRSARPRQLHDDWTWGGCGDDLEFGYKFSQTFIDIREKERKRGARGLVSIPLKYPKLDEKLLTEEMNETSENPNNNSNSNSPFKPEDLLELQEIINKEIFSSKVQEKEMQELQAKINQKLLNSKVFNFEHQGLYRNTKKMNRLKSSGSAKARTMMNLHNNEAGRRAVIKKSRITCKCHGVSGSCSLITCWQQLTSMREIGDYLHEKYDEATQVKINKRGRLQVKDPRYKVPTALDLVYLDESPDWCRINRQLQWPGTHNRVCNKTSLGLDGCAILCCGRGYNTKKIVVKERCNCKFHWCCHVKCDVCTKVVEEYSCK